MTALDRFDPDSFVAPDAPVTTPHDEFPDAWRHGLAILAERSMPPGSNPDRWEEIVADCHAFARRWGAEAINLGWSIGSVFGFELAQPSGLVGVALDIRGGVVVDISRDWIAVRRLNSTSYLQREMPDEAWPIWAFKGRV